MKILFLKGSLLLVALLLIKQLINIVSPVHEKREVIMEYNTRQLIETGVNTVFLGTSRIKRGVVPAIVDSICPGLSSYNFGENHFAFPYASKWAEDNLEKLSDLKVLVVELTGPGEKILDLKSWSPYAWASIVPSNGWAYEQKMFAMLRENFMETYLSPLPNMNTLLQGIDSSRVNADVQETFGEKIDKNIPHDDRNLSLLLNNEYTQKAIARQKRNAAERRGVPSAYRLAINRLKAQCRAANVQLIFLAPPIFAGEEEVYIYQSLIPHLSLNEIPLLTISHPLLFNASHRFDYRHFNVQGAQLYSRELGKALKEVLQ